MSIAPTAPSGHLAAELVATACPLCGAGGTRSAYAFPPHRVVRCANCGLWYLTPRLAEGAMLDVYREDRYFEGEEGPGYSSYRAQEPTLRHTFRRLLRDLERRGLTGGRLLEVGCAYGYLLDEARPYFAYRAGTEYSTGAAAAAQRLGDAVYLGGLDAVPGEEPWDVIALVHVIEHVYDPVTLLAEAVARLRPGGTLLVATPDFGGFWRTLLGRRWPFFKVPEHVTFFDRATLAALLGRAGCVDVRRFPYWSVFSLDLVGEKLGRRLPGPIARLPVWLPHTTVAAIGRAPATAVRSPAG